MNKYEKYVQDVQEAIEASGLKFANNKELEVSGLLDTVVVDAKVKWFVDALNRLKEQELKIKVGNNKLKQQILIPQLEFFFGSLGTISYYDIDVSDEDFKKFNEDVEKLLLECENEMDAGTMLKDMLDDILNDIKGN